MESPYYYYYNNNNYYYYYCNYYHVYYFGLFLALLKGQGKSDRNTEKQKG